MADEDLLLKFINRDKFKNFNLFSIYPEGRDDCIYCPPGREDLFVRRLFWRPILSLNLSLNDKKRFFILKLLLFPFFLLISLFLELIYEAFNRIRKNMKTTLLFIAILLLMVIPVYFLLVRPEEYNVTVQIIFSVFLTVCSTFFGALYSNKSAKRAVTSKWLPAAESACKRLMVISATTKRMMIAQRAACSKISPLIPRDDATSRGIKAIVDVQCAESADRLASLQEHVEQAIDDWRVFIGGNCDGRECSLIESRLNIRRQEIESNFTPPGAGGCLEKNAECLEQ